MPLPVLFALLRPAPREQVLHERAFRDQVSTLSAPM